MAMSAISGKWSEPISGPTSQRSGVRPFPVKTWSILTAIGIPRTDALSLQPYPLPVLENAFA